MSSLIKNSIEIMGDQSVQEEPISTHTTDQPDQGGAAISWIQSFKDWWNFSLKLMRPTTIQNDLYKQARLKNIMIEYELYKAILSDDIKVYKPNEIPSTDDKNIIIGYFVDTKINANGELIHEFCLENRLPLPEGGGDQSIPSPIVIVHGYMAASGYFVKMFERLIKSKPGLKIHVIDLPGFGNSSRPKLPKTMLKTYRDHYEQINQIIQIENWFIDRFESWRLLQPELNDCNTGFTLMGHSMGAYLMSCYLMKYPNINCKDYILVSPMGTESNYESLINEKSLQINYHEIGAKPLQELITKQSETNGVIENEELIKLWEHLGKPKFPQSLLLKKMWQWNISPFQLLQMFGPAFSKILSYWSFQRFKNLKDNYGKNNYDLILKLHNYSYSIFNQFQGSGELSITKLVNFEILPKLPLADRKFDEFLINHKINTLWLYGEKDWMNFKGGELIHNKVENYMNSNANPGFKAGFKLVKNAGHHIYLDNPEEFNSIVIDFLK